MVVGHGSVLHTYFTEISATKGLMIRAVSFFPGERHKISSNFEVLREWGLDVSEKDRKKM